MTHREKAIKYFCEGYNCAQAVFAAFSDVTGYSEEDALMLASSFGGGMGRMREVCGAVSGMLMVAGYLYGYDGPDEGDSKMAHYALVQDLAGKFREQAGSIVCREILKNPPTDPTPCPRTAEYYKLRPCARMVLTAATLMEEFIAAHPLEKENG